MKIAIIGTGIAGNVAAYYLAREHDITVYEANDYIGGHTHTHDIQLDNRRFAIDSGFIVFNYRTYPEFTRLLNELKVEVQPSNMSFSVKSDKTGLEYNGTTLNSLFAQRSNLLRPSFYRMIQDILRFNQEAPRLLEEQDENLSLGEYLSRNGYRQEFIQHYILPMGAAIWSSTSEMMQQFPAYYFIRFFHNHGMLSVNDRPTWHVIKNGSREYVKKLIHPYRDRIRLNSPVTSIRRFPDRVEVTSAGQPPESYDYVFIASHSDQALSMLQDPSSLEKTILGAIPYQDNEAVLHTDQRMLPKRKLAWAAWNYHLLPRQQERVAITYNMNILQGIRHKTPFCVTLNHSQAIDERKILKCMNYHHPVFTPDAIKAQQRQGEINGPLRTFYCGAYWRYGFHEDGVVSALNALKHFEECQHEELYLSRAS